MTWPHSIPKPLSLGYWTLNPWPVSEQAKAPSSKVFYLKVSWLRQVWQTHSQLIRAGGEKQIFIKYIHFWNGPLEVCQVLTLTNTFNELSQAVYVGIWWHDRSHLSFLFLKLVLWKSGQKGLMETLRVETFQILLIIIKGKWAFLKKKCFMDTHTHTHLASNVLYV